MLNNNTCGKLGGNYNEVNNGSTDDDIVFRKTKQTWPDFNFGYKMCCLKVILIKSLLHV